jgi:hypothetical protein
MLNEQHIEQLFKFVKKKGVEWYDVQIELVDHLANSIEELQMENPALGFEDALQQVYKGFGIFGFSHIVRDKTEMAQRQAKRHWLKAFKGLFTWPNVLRTIALAAIIYTTALFLNYLYCYVLLFLVILIKMIKVFQLKAKAGKSKLLLNQSTYTISFGFLFNYLTILFLKEPSEVQAAHSQQYTVIIAAVLFFEVLSFLATVKVISDVNEQARLLYPKAFI